jgi:hypothetical protein
VYLTKYKAKIIPDSKVVEQYMCLHCSGTFYILLLLLKKIHSAPFMYSTVVDNITNLHLKDSLIQYIGHDWCQVRYRPISASK